MVLGNEDDVTIKAKISVEAEDSLSRSLELLELTEDAMVKLASQAKKMEGSFKEASQGMILSLKAVLKEEIAAVKEKYKAHEDAAAIIKGEVDKLVEAHEKEVMAIRNARGELDKMANTRKEATDAQQNQGMSLAGLKNQWLAMVAILATVIASMRKYVEIVKEAIQAGQDFALALFKLEASVRVLQKLGLDITMQDVKERMVELREQFGMFTDQELANGIAQINLLTRNFGFSIEQMEKLQEIAASVAVLMGEDFDEAARKLAQFMASGYGEALQRAGFAVSRLAIQEEARRMGMEKTFLMLTEQERAEASLSLIERQSVEVIDEATRRQATFEGQIKATTSEIETLRAEMGLRYLPIKLLVTKATLLLITAFSKLLVIVTKMGIGFIEGLIIPFIAVREALDGNIRSVADFADVVRELHDQMIELSGLETFERFGEDIDEFLRGMNKAVDDTKSMMQELMDALGPDILELIGDRNQDRIDAQQDLFDKLLDIQMDAERKAEDIEQRHADKMVDINIKMGQRIDDANLRREQQLEDLAIDTQRKREDAARKFREAELKAERDFQEKLRRLKEGFLLNLEDALREQDAKQVLRLIRQYNMQKAQLEREGAGDKTDRQEKYNQELADIELQRQRKEAAIQQAHERRLADIERQSEREREAADEARERAFEDLKADLQRSADELKSKFDEDIKDINKKFQEDLLDVMMKAATEFGITTDAEFQEIAAVVNKYLGSAADGVEGFSGMLNSAVRQALIDITALELAKNRLDMIMNAVPLSNVPATPLSEITGMAAGGSILATTPTLAMFGEAGPEMATFTPLSSMSGFGSSVSPQAGMGGSISGEIRIGVDLSPGLEASIIDKTLDEAGKVIFDVVGAG